ncbi:MAG: ABC transporter permease [Acutalibacteraceae bacterium]|nr:ABC transporter permease [Acutalibacteraceae bacterium]
MKKNKNNLKEPFVRIVKRDNISYKKIILIYAIATVGGLILSGLISMMFSNKGLGDFFQSLFAGAFGSERKFWLLLQDTTLLLGASMALLPAFKMKFWNLGGNGQILVGCLSAIACMFYLGGKVNDTVIIVLMFFASIISGAIWAVIPALFKAKFNTNESLFTLMMNYIAQGLVSLCITLWVKSGSGVLSPISYGNIPDIGNKYLLPIILFVSITILMYIYLRSSKHGYEISVVGESINTAKYVGIKVDKVIIRTMILSGAIAGLVGFVLAGSINHTISTASANNMGFTGIMATWLGAFNPIIIILTSFFITFISKGMVEVRKTFMFTNDSISNIVVGVVYFAVIICSFFINYKLVFRKKDKEELKK